MSSVGWLEAGPLVAGRAFGHDLANTRPVVLLACEYPCLKGEPRGYPA